MTPNDLKVGMKIKFYKFKGTVISFEFIRGVRNYWDRYKIILDTGIIYVKYNIRSIREWDEIETVPKVVTKRKKVVKKEFATCYSLPPTKKVFADYDSSLPVKQALIDIYNWMISDYKDGSWVCDICTNINPKNMGEECHKCS